jgi:hypothetical protein
VGNPVRTEYVKRMVEGAEMHIDHLNDSMLGIETDTIRLEVCI